MLRNPEKNCLIRCVIRCVKMIRNPEKMTRCVKMIRNPEKMCLLISQDGNPLSKVQVKSLVDNFKTSLKKQKKDKEPESKDQE